MKTALLLIAHGSRQEEANEDLRLLGLELLREGTYQIVEFAFLELAEPTIETAGQRCAASGIERVILLPYFLSAGVHVRRDLQNACTALKAAHPAIDWRLAEPIGLHPLMNEIVLERAALAGG